MQARTTHDAMQRGARGTSSSFAASGRILDTSFRLVTDDRRFLADFRRHFCNLPPLPDPEGGRHGLLFRVGLRSPAGAFVRVEQASGPCGGPSVRSRSLHGHPFPRFAALHAISEELLRRAGDFFVAHAAVVAFGPRGLVLCGPSGAGKTTLTRSLLRAGAVYYSDDYCPFHLGTRLVHPFPRSMLVRGPVPGLAGPGSRGGGPEAREGGPAGKTVLPWRPALTPCRPRAVVCLDPGGPPDGTNRVRLLVRNGAAGALGARLAALSPRVAVQAPSGEGDFLRLRYPEGAGLTRPVRQLLAQHEGQIWHAFREDAPRPDFSREPGLVPVSVREAALALLRETRQMPELRGAPGEGRLTASRLFTRIAGLLTGAKCYRLRTGRLDAMTRLLVEIMEESP